MSEPAKEASDEKVRDALKSINDCLLLLHNEDKEIAELKAEYARLTSQVGMAQFSRDLQAERFRRIEAKIARMRGKLISYKNTINAYLQKTP